MQAFGRGARAPVVSDEAPPAPKPYLEDKPTRKLRRDLPGVQLALDAAPATEIPPDLEDRLRWHAQLGGGYRVILAGGRVEELGTPAEVMDLVRREPEAVLGIEVDAATSGYLALFKRPDARDEG